VACNKSCAQRGNSSHRKKVEPVSVDIRMHVKHYTPGSREFKELASLYGG
jgi:hypothetical protein